MKKCRRQFVIVVSLLFIIMLLSNCEDTTEPSVRVVETPEFSVASNTYSAGFNVAISCATEGATIRYSTESYDDESFMEYTGAITISDHTTVLAYATAEGMTDSGYNRADYAIIADDSGNLIGNGDFSKGEALWFLWVNEEENADAECSFNSGSASSNIVSPGDNEWSMSLQYVTRPTIKNERIYTLSFEASASRSRTIVVKIGEDGRDLNDNGEIYDAYLWQMFDLTTVSQTFTVDFIMDNPTDDAAEFAFYLGKYSGDVAIDNVSLTVTDPEPIDSSLITDENLKRAIADNAGVSVNELDTLNGWSLVDLHAENYGISDLSGINQFTGLIWLYLFNNNISSLAPLVGLTNLKDLGVRDNHLNYEDFSVVTNENFPKLQHISLNGGDSLDLEANVSGLILMLASLPNLNGFEMNELGIDDSEFSDLYNAVILPRIDNFYGLSVYNNDLGDASLGLIANITNITWLYIGGNDSISDLSILEGNTSLLEFRIWGTSVTELAPLKNLYDAGAFRDESSPIVVEWMDLDLSPGTPNRAVVDYLVNHGVNVLWENGNTTE